MRLFDRLKFITKSYYNAYFGKKSRLDTDYKEDTDSAEQYQYEYHRESNTYQIIPDNVVKARDKLGLTGAEPWEEVHKKFCKLMKKYHPDKHQDPKDIERANEISKSITEAYEVLKRYAHR